MTGILLLSTLFKWVGVAFLSLKDRTTQHDTIKFKFINRYIWGIIAHKDSLD